MYYQNETDETLVLLTLAGEQRAYEALVVRYQKPFYGRGCSPGCLCYCVDETEYPAGNRQIRAVGVPHCQELRGEYAHPLPKLSAP